MREVKEGFKEQLAVIGLVQITNDPESLYIELQIEENLSAAEYITNRAEIGELVLAYKTLDLRELKGKPIWAQSSKSDNITMYLRPWKGK